MGDAKNIKKTISKRFRKRSKIVRDKAKKDANLKAEVNAKEKNSKKKEAKQKKKNYRQGHRKRVKERFKKHGLGTMTDVEVLEMLLFYVLPRKDTKEVAYNLIDTFGGMDRVLNAESKFIQEVAGVGEGVGLYIEFIRAFIARVLELKWSKKTKKIKTLKDAGDFFIPLFMNERVEVLYLMLLDSEYNIIENIKLSEGTSYSSVVDYDKIFRCVTAMEAGNLIIAHNHPNAMLKPSEEDINVTIDLYNVLRNLEIDVHFKDHIIVRDNKYISIMKYINEHNISMDPRNK